ncbi:MAG TPA: DUF5011 domain-containing protein [Bacteroidales bacterium]|nr:DUF5011 domain-containing protein [Bacteroidales bacterium]
MKKIIPILLVLALGGTALMTSCTADDTTAPVVTLSGDPVVDHLLNTAYVDAGATATDEEDGELVVQVLNNVDPDLIGTYLVEFSATDNAGNTGTAERVVNVIVKQVSFVFNWAVVDTVTGVGAGIYDYNSTITASAVDLNKILITNFGGFGTDVIVTATFDKFGNITIANQALVGVDPGSEGSVTGTGVMADHGNQIFIEYTITYNAGGTDTGHATFTKQ